MKSLWAAYIWEREECETHENEDGFITYKVMPNGDMFIRDMFVSPEIRDRGRGQFLFDELTKIAILKNCKQFVCQVDLRAKNATHSLSVILSRGFDAVGADNHVITLSRAVNYGRSC